jgi:tetratricopeptide (TPR) repeat protein
MQKNEKPAANDDAGEGVNSFIQKHRKSIYIAAGTVVVALLAVVITVSVMSMLNKKAITAVEELGDRYESLRSFITASANAAADASSDDAAADEVAAGDVATLLADIKSFAGKKSGYAAGRAWSIAAAIHSEKKEWDEAENAWIQAAQAAKKTYMVPIAWFNAGAAAEEQGKTEAAVSHYTNAVSSDEGFASAPRAQFAIGRLNETLENNEEAIAAYRALIDRWPNDTVWTNLAQSRIILLESK